MALVKWTRKAKADLKEIAQFYIMLADKELAKRKVTGILLDISKIANNPLLGRQDKN